MSQEKTYAITESALKRMAASCAVAKDVLKSGFPEAFNDAWVDVTDRVTIRAHRHHLGIGIHLYDEEKLLGYLKRDGQFDLIFGSENYRADRFEDGDFSGSRFCYKVFKKA